MSERPKTAAGRAIEEIRQRRAAERGGPAVAEGKAAVLDEIKAELAVKRKRKRSKAALPATTHTIEATSAPETSIVRSLQVCEWLAETLRNAPAPEGPPPLQEHTDSTRKFKRLSTAEIFAPLGPEPEPEPVRPQPAPQPRAKQVEKPSVLQCAACKHEIDDPREAWFWWSIAGRGVAFGPCAAHRGNCSRVLENVRNRENVDHGATAWRGACNVPLDWLAHPGELRRISSQWTWDGGDEHRMTMMHLALVSSFGTRKSLSDMLCDVCKLLIADPPSAVVSWSICMDEGSASDVRITHHDDHPLTTGCHSVSDELFDALRGWINVSHLGHKHIFDDLLSRYTWSQADKLALRVLRVVALGGNGDEPEPSRKKKFLRCACGSQMEVWQRVCGKCWWKQKNARR